MVDSEKILSQHEVDALLSAIDSGGGEVAADSAAAVYDFRHPARLAREPLRAIEGILESFAGRLQTALSALLHTTVEVKPAGVHQVTLRDFVDSLAKPTVLNVLSCEPLEGNFLLSLSPSVACPMIERLCGSAKVGAWPQDRPLSTLEWNVIETVVVRALDLLREAWAPVAAVHLRVLRRETDPGRLPLSNASEPAVSAILDIALGDQRGSLDLAFPLLSIEGLQEKLVASMAMPLRKKEPAGEGESAISRRLAPSEVRVEASLPVENLRLKDLRVLRAGDLLVTNHPQRAPILVGVEGRPKFQARLGRLKDRKAVKVLGSLATGREPGAPPARTLLGVRRAEAPAGGGPAAAIPPPGLVEHLLQLPLSASVVVAERTMCLRDVLALKPGQVIEFAKRAEELLELRAARRGLALGTAVRIGEHFGLRVSSVRDPRERVLALGP